MIKCLSDRLLKTVGVVALVGLSTADIAQTLNWSPVGPIVTAGRARNMVVDRNDPSGNTLYVGSTSSGVFRSTDAGVNWNPLNDQGTIRNISYMAQSIDGKLFAATGEGFLRSSQKTKALPGTGIYELNGNVFTQKAGAAVTGSVITKLVTSPLSAQVMALTSEKGVLFSVDQGTSWTNAANTPTDQAGLDVKFDANGILYCSIGGETGNIPSTIWKASSSNLQAATFNNITPVSGVVTNTMYGRIELAIAPSNPQVVYASVAGKYTAAASSSLAGLFVSYNGGNTWGVIHVGSAQLDPLTNGTTRSSGDYAHVVTVDPGNHNRVHVASFRNYVFTRTGGSDASPVGSWINISSTNPFLNQFFVNQNIHDIKLVGSGSSTKYYFITDAGIFRSIDLWAYLNSNGMIASFQPFYKGLVTGQFNSVSIERFPLANNVNGAPGSSVVPFGGFIGGTGGNGLIYYRGAYPNVTQEVSYIGGDIYNAEFSKLLPNAAYFTAAAGPLYRTTDVKTAFPDQLDLLENTANQKVINFSNSSYSVTGTPFKLWENYGQRYKGSALIAPDSLVFFNDTSFALSSIPSLTSSTSFTFSVGRPQARAAIDYIAIRTTTVKVAAGVTSVAVTGWSVVNTKTLGIKPDAYTLPMTGTLNVPIASVDGYTNNTPLTSNKIILNSNTEFDEIQVVLANPLFTNQPSTVPSVTNVETYVRMKATVYYRYDSLANITIEDNSISTLGNTYTVQTRQSLKWIQPATSTLNDTTNRVQKYAQPRSARLAVSYGNNGILVSKAPLDMNAPISFIKVSANKAVTTNSLGESLAPTQSNTVAVNGKPTLIEWSRSGTELYYATDQNNLYRVSHLYTILDSSSRSYNGKLQTGIFKYGSSANNPTVNPRSPYRTTFLGNFPGKITSISVAQNDSIILLTTDSPTMAVVVNNSDIRKCDASNVNFVNKTGTGLGNSILYCSMLEKNDYKKAFIGTDNGVYYTPDVTAASPSWTQANSGQLPNVQIFDIKQQVMDPWESYNSGQIYVATNGRGIWVNKEFYVPTVVSVQEIVKSATESLLQVYPNPTNGDVNITFRGYDNESVNIQVMDINGRLVMSNNLGKIVNGEVKVNMGTEGLPTGIYIINVASDSGIKRVSKLVVTK